MARPDPPSAAGSPVRVLAMYPPDTCGVGSDPDCAPVPTNASIKLRFDRFLNPATVNRQAIQVYTGDPQFSPGVTFQVVYDPVERVVEFRVPPGQGFAAQALYTIVLNVAKEDGDFGIRAFDGAPLSEADGPLKTSFLTGDGPVAQPLDSALSCATVVSQVFGQALGNCTGSACHASSGNHLGAVSLAGPPYGLALDDADAFVSSAVRRIAHETELGDQSGGVPEESPPRLGVRMPLIDPRSPGNSYLLYKLFLQRANFEACPPQSASPVCQQDPAADPSVSTHSDIPLGEGESVVPSDEELVRLREWFVRGEPMPRPQLLQGQLVEGNVHLQGLRALSTFIAAGADCERHLLPARVQAALRARGAATPAAISVDSP